jgi:hypothetical protein
VPGERYTEPSGNWKLSKTNLETNMLFEAARLHKRRFATGSGN